MNIFFLDKSIIKCAEYHCDKHVVKMRLELAQLACTAHWVSGSPYAPYKPTHQNHPSAIWTRESLSNYKYVVTLGLTLCEELKLRFNTPRQETQTALLWLAKNMPDIKDYGITQPKLAMPDEAKIVTDEKGISFAVQNYRNYYATHKQHLHKWTNRTVPYWLV